LPGNFKTFSVIPHIQFVPWLCLPWCNNRACLYRCRYFSCITTI